MSGPQPPSSQQVKRQKAAGGCRVKVYLHAVTDAQAELLTDVGRKRPLEEISKKTGTDIQFYPYTSPVPGMKIVIICGVPSKIEMVVRLIRQVTGAQDTLSAQAQTFWLQWVEAAYPDLESRAYFLPPVYFNRVPMTRQTIAGQDVMVLDSPSERRGLLTKIRSLLKSSKTHEPQHQAVLPSNTPVMTPSQTAETSISHPATAQDSDIRDDTAMKQVLLCLQSLSKKKGEVLVGITRLDFGQYLSEPGFSVAAAQLPRTSSLPPDLPQNWKQGKFDVLLIHRHYGLVVCNVMSVGHITNDLKMSQEDIVKTIRKKLRDAVSQLNKAEAMLSHLVSDVCPGLRITKTIAVPNLTTDQVQQAISHDSQLTEDLHCCLKTTDPADITGVCLCCDQLSDPKTPCDVSSHVLKKLGEWWTRRVTMSGPDSHMTRHVYKTLVARFCGPATTVTVPCTCPPRVSVKTLGEAVWWTGECYTAVITLFPEQVHLLHTAPPRLFVAGPPGTGKTVVLLLMAIEWLRCGHHVYVVSTWWGSRAACSMLYHLLLQTVKTQQSAGVSPGQPHLLQYDLELGKDVEKAVNDLSQAASGGSLYVIADEIGNECSLGYRNNNFRSLCKLLPTRVPRLHLWAASCFHDNALANWPVEYLTRPLRSPPAVVREVEQDARITTHRRVLPYIERGVPDHTDGPPVTRLYHRGQGHSSRRPVDCVTCGREVASFLHSLRVGVTGRSTTTSTTLTSTSVGTTPPCLQWRDVLVLNWDYVSDQSGMVTGLQEAGIPVQLMKDDDIEDVATARSDVVWVASGLGVRGLERKVVVCLEDPDYNFTSVRLDLLSRCTSQLVIVFTDYKPLEDVAAQTTPDPCLDGNYQNLTDVHRSVSYVTAYPEPPLCDIDLVTGWYRFVVDAESKMPETCVDTFKCGTTVPIWMNGTHPSVNDGIQTRRACANLQTGGASYTPCCGHAIYIGVKNCGVFFVYYLHPPPACPMAYCAGKDAPCPAGKWSPTGFSPGCKDPYPQLTDPPSFRGPVIEQNTFYFTCDLTFSGKDPDQVFEFVWLFDGLEDPKVPSENVSDPGRSARLDGAKLAGLLNKNVGCKVRAFYKPNVIEKGPWLESTRTYWAGIQTDPTHVSIRTDEDKHEVVIRSTLPVLCSSTLIDRQCCLWIHLFVNGSEGNQDALVMQTDCKYSLCKSNWNSTSQEVSRTVSVVASKTQMQYGTKNLLVSFANIVVADASPYQQIFQGFKIPSVQVDVEQRDSKLCSIIGDPHITGLENKRTFHLFRVGDYTAYKNAARDFEVQIRTWPCNGVTCICGVAVREKDDLIRVNGCNHGFYGQHVGSPEISVLRRLREGTTILQATDGSTITLYFPSSSEIKITAWAWLGGFLNLDISVPGTDYLNGRGLCGTFDNNPNNDLTHRSGFVDTMPADYVPEGFTESWKNDDNASLFRIVPPETGESYVPQYCKCNDERIGTVNCTYLGDIVSRILPCAPNCQDTTGKSSSSGGSSSKRRKRSVSGKTYVDSDEIDQVYDPNDYADFRPPTLSWPTSTGINESQAENYCSTALRQSQLWSHCQDKTQEIQGLIVNCKIDILVANNYTGAETIVEAFLTICKVELAKNPDNYVTTPTGEIVVKPEISDDVCNPVCYINGRCDRGRCVCIRGFIGDNCQIKDEPPKLLGIRGSSFCDFHESPCKQVFINAENIQNTATMACKIQEILDDGSVLERASMEEAVFLTLNKLSCALPDAGIETEKSVKRFYITATIDGSRYSNAVNMTVYDSICQNCTQEGCWKLPDTCLINNLCFQDGELNPNDTKQVCNVSASTMDWSPVHTVGSDYPAIMSVIVSRSEDNTQLRCEVNADASKPTASFRVAWGVDGVWREESVLPNGHLEAAISLSEVSYANQVACRARSMFTDNNVFSPYTYSNVFSPSTSSNVFSPSTSSNVFSPSTSSNVFSPSTSSNVFSPSTSSNVFSPSTSSNVFSPSTSSNDFSPSTSSNVFSPSTSSNVFSPNTYTNPSSVTPVPSSSTVSWIRTTDTLHLTLLTALGLSGMLWSV